MKNKSTENQPAGKIISLSPSSIDAIAARVFAKIQEREMHFKQVRLRRLKDRLEISYRPLTPLGVNSEGIVNPKATGHATAK